MEIEERGGKRVKGNQCIKQSGSTSEGLTILSTKSIVRTETSKRSSIPADPRPMSDIWVQGPVRRVAEKLIEARPNSRPREKMQLRQGWRLEPHRNPHLFGWSWPNEMGQLVRMAVDTSDGHVCRHGETGVGNRDACTLVAAMAIWRSDIVDCQPTFQSSKVAFCSLV